MIIKLGRRLNIRQVALATAEIYLTRFLTRVLLKEINVYVLVTTCLYVSCKIEECPQHIRLIISEARNLWPEYIPHDVTKLAEFEFYLIEEMDLFLFLHHPYKSLIQIRDFLSKNVAIYGFSLTDEELQNSWSLINDSYITDLHLLLPPHIIAVAAVYITIVLKKHLSRGNNGSGNDSGKDGAMHIDDLMTLANPAGQGGAHSVGGASTSSSVHTNAATTTDTTSDTNLETTHFQDMKVDEDTVKINKFMNFLDHLHINLDEVVEAMQDMINVYVVWNRYNEGGVKRALQMMLLSR